MLRSATVPAAVFVLALACSPPAEPDDEGAGDGDDGDAGASTGASAADDDGDDGGSAPTASAGTSADGEASGPNDDDGTTDPSDDATTATEDPDADADFAARCAAPGVLLCRGFDTADELEPTCCENQTGAEPADGGDWDHIAIDEDIRASGTGALRFEIVGQTGSNHSGAFRQLMGQAFGPGTTFYTQFRLRLSPEFIDTQWDSVVGSSPKIVIFHHSSATCNDIEWTQVMNGWYSHIATMYTHCGQYAPGGPQDGTQWMQQGDYNCPYGADYANDPMCLKYTPDAWMTFYFSATLGEWGTPTTHLQAWISIDGQPYQQWIDDPAFTFYAEGESVAGFDSVYLTTYMTAKDGTADHPTAYAWYDELIVSTEPIAVPGGR
jgi:hypothetical protein